MKFPGWISRTPTVMAFLCGLLNAGEPATAVATVSTSFVTDITATPRGSEYLSAPAVRLAAPPLQLRLTMDPELSLKVSGASGLKVRVDWSGEISGPWTPWSNVVVGASDFALVGLSGEGDRRFYRVGTVSDPRPTGPTDFVWIEPGSFVMGSSLSEPGRQQDEVQHTVILSRGFWLSNHEVTQGEYMAVMGENPSFYKGNTNRPVENVHWNEAVEYCKKLTEKDRAAGRITASQEYRLPTEAEWEYAARAGTTGQRHGELDAIAWWSGNSGGQTRPVKQKAPNAWGLYDMIGNVMEWCADWRDEYPTGTAVDPMGPELGDSSLGVRVVRGGSGTPEQARSAYRFSFRPYMRTDYLGFRTALSAGPTTELVAPSITASPQPVTVMAGQTARFTVMVAGTAPLAFQWQLNGVDLLGATAANYTVNNAQLANAGEYRVVVSNLAGSVTSTPAVLTVTPAVPPPVILTQPAGATRTVGQSVTFSVAASGSGPLSYQWYLNGSPIAGANTTTLVLPSVKATDAGTYTAGVRNTAGEVLSNAALLTVNPAPIAPVITAQPQAVTVMAGQTAQFSITATGTAPLAYQWQRNGVNIAGATAANCSVVNAQSANVGSYRVIVSNAAGSVTSTAATLTVTQAVPPPVVLTHPAAATRTVGQSVTFTIAASGSGSLAYQWYLDGIPIAGANAPSYTLPAVALTDAGAYTAGVRNTAGEVLSNPAALIVNPAPIPKLNLRLESNGRLTFTWDGTARLNWSPTLTGAFSPVPNAASGYQALPGGDHGFYRLVP